MKVRLIEPEPAGMNVYSRVTLPRLGLPLIGAKLKQHGHDVRIYEPNIAPVVWPDVYGADLVGISTTTSTVSEGYRIADEARARGIPVIMGGSHVTFMADEALEHADYVARGEGGEELMLELIDALHGERAFDGIKGLSFMADGQAVHNESRGWCTNLDDLPFPDLTLIHGSENLRSTPMMTSWGCPFDCNFCSVTAMFGKKYRFRSAENVIAELREKRPRKIFFYDDNMAASKRRLKELLQRMIEEDLVTNWAVQVRADVARDRELLGLMQQSGCSMVFLGLESVSQETLDAYEKKQTVEDIVESVRVLHEYGIMTHGMFVVGADPDTKQTVRDTVSFAIKHHIDTTMISILTPLPGTRQFDDLDAAGRIFDKRWHLYDSHHAVFDPKNMTALELQLEVRDAYMRFYSVKRWLKYFFTFRFRELLFQSWGVSIIRAWGKDGRNQAFMKELEDAGSRQRPAAAASRAR